MDKEVKLKRNRSEEPLSSAIPDTVTSIGNITSIQSNRETQTKRVKTEEFAGTGDDYYITDTDNVGQNGDDINKLLTNQVYRYRDESNRLRARNLAKNQQIKELSDKIIQLQEKLNNVHSQEKQQLKGYQETLNASETDLLKNNLQKYRNIINSLQEELEAKKKEFDESQVKLCSVNVAKQKADEVVLKTKDEVDGLLEHIQIVNKASEVRYANAIANVEMYRKKCEKMEHEKTSLQNQTNIMYNSMSATLRQKESVINKLSYDLMKERSDWRMKLSNLNSQVLRISQVTLVCKDATEKLENEKKEWETREARMISQVDSMSQEVKHYKSMVETLENVIKDSENTLKECIKAQEVSVNTCAEWETKESALKSQVQAMSQKVQHYEALNKRLELENEEKELKLRECIESNEAVIRKCTAMEEEMTLLQENNENSIMTTLKSKIRGLRNWCFEKNIESCEEKEECANHF